MPRKMSKAPTQAWRAVVVWEYPSGGTSTEYLGPYWRRQDAQGRVSNLQRAWGKTVASARIESAPLGEWSEA